MLNNCFNDKDLINTQNFLDSATDEDLIKGISSIASASKTIGSFYEQAKMILRIHNAMMQRKNAVKECEKSWGSYCDQAFIYNQALTVRISYRRFKKEYGYVHYECDHKPAYKRFIDLCKDPSRCKYPKEIRNMSEDLIRRSTFSENSKNGISQPAQPEIYYNCIDEIPIIPQNDSDLLKSVGHENLKYILTNLLEQLDDEGVAGSSLFFSFAKFCYPNASHKKPDYILTNKKGGIHEFELEISDYLAKLSALKKESLHLISEIRKKQILLDSEN